MPTAGGSSCPTRPRPGRRSSSSARPTRPIHRLHAATAGRVRGLRRDRVLRALDRRPGGRRGPAHPARSSARATGSSSARPTSSSMGGRPRRLRFAGHLGTDHRDAPLRVAGRAGWDGAGRARPDVRAERRDRGHARPSRQARTRVGRRDRPTVRRPWPRSTTTGRRATSCPGRASTRRGCASATGCGSGSAPATTRRSSGSSCARRPTASRSSSRLTEADADRAARWWEVELDLAMPSTGYRFLVLTAAGPRWLNGTGLHEATPTDRDDFVRARRLRPAALAGRPGLLPDLPRPLRQRRPGQRRGRRGLDVPRPGGPPTGRGTDLPDPRPPALASSSSAATWPASSTHLDHLVDLGVNAIYLNPIFASRSNHGYDIIDYEHVADHFGGDAALIALREATRERDIRLILDIAPNHVGVEHPWFQAAQADPAAPTASYFVFREHPDDYESWLGVRSLPKLDYRAAGLRAAMYDGRRRRPAALAAAAVRGRRLAHRRRQHARTARARPARAGGRPRDARRGQGRGPRRVPARRARLRRHRPPGRRPVGRGHGLLGLPAAGPRLAAPGSSCGATRAGSSSAPGASTTDTLVRTMAAFRAAIPWTVARQPAGPPRQPRHAAHRVRSSTATRAGSGRPSGSCSRPSGSRACCTATRSACDGEDGDDTRRPMPWDRAAVGPRAPRVRALARPRCGSASPALTTGGFQVLETGDDHLAYLRDADDPVGRRRHRPRAGSAAGRAARRRATAPSPTARASRSTSTGRDGDASRTASCASRRRRPASRSGVADGAAMTDDVSADFVFGTLATDELRLAQLRATASGVHHGHDLEPLDPDPDQPITVRVHGRSGRRGRPRHRLRHDRRHPTRPARWARRRAARPSS